MTERPSPDPREPRAWRGKGTRWRCCRYCAAILEFWDFKLRCPREGCPLAGEPQ